MARTLGMSAFSLELAQQLLKQTRSIDETAMLMTAEGDSHNWKRWRDKILRAVEQGKLSI